MMAAPSSHTQLANSRRLRRSTISSFQPKLWQLGGCSAMLGLLWYSRWWWYRRCTST